jgi:hypothetical protein
MAAKTGKCVFCEAQGYQFYKVFLCPDCASGAGIWTDGERWGGVYVRKGGSRNLARALIGNFGGENEGEVVREKRAMLFFIASQPPLG